MRRRERSDDLVERVSELILVQIVCCFQMNELVVGRIVVHCGFTLVFILVFYND